MPSPIPYTIINDQVRRNCFAEIERLSRNNPRIRVRIDEVDVSKSAKQLGYVWAGMYPCIKQYLYDKTDQSFDIASVIHPYHVEAHNGEIASAISKSVNLGLGDYTIRRSMSGWGVGPMRQYIDWVLMTYADKYQLYIPEPDKWKSERGLG